MDETRQLTVDGYVFENMQDYEDALKEKEGIKYLNRQIDLNDSAKTYAVYKEILDKKIFRTPVGIQYMNRLRQSLIQSGMSDVPCIPVSRVTEKKAGDRELKKLSEKYKKKNGTKSARFAAPAGEFPAPCRNSPYPRRSDPWAFRSGGRPAGRIPPFPGCMRWA